MISCTLGTHYSHNKLPTNELQKQKVPNVMKPCTLGTICMSSGKSIAGIQETYRTAHHPDPTPRNALTINYLQNTIPLKPHTVL